MDTLKILPPYQPGYIRQDKPRSGPVSNLSYDLSGLSYVVMLFYDYSPVFFLESKALAVKWKFEILQVFFFGFYEPRVLGIEYMWIKIF